MNQSPSTSSYDLAGNDAYPPQLAASAVSWGAILAGAVGASALSLILLILGVGLGLSAVSPWTRSGIGAGTFGVSTILWVTFTQLAAAGIGGYLAGRLRTKWISVHTDEVYFRDTAHGFLAWAVASLATATLLTSTIGAIVDSGIQAGATAASGVATAAASAAGSAAAATGPAKTDAPGMGAGADPMGYFVDSLFRKDPGAAANATGSDTAQDDARTSAEVTRIFVSALRNGSLPADDQRYVGQVVAKRTGLAQPEAEQRVSDAFARVQTAMHETEVAAKTAADKARKASAYTALWLFVSLLVGAFFASWIATFGGRLRDS